MEGESIDYDSDDEASTYLVEDDSNDIDLNQFYRDYNHLKKNYKTMPVLNKYEKTRIISERAQQLANGSISFLQNPEAYNSVHDIAIQELNQKKLPFIIKRKVSMNQYELWKLEDLLII
tara:strand:+ start:6304 stop:6660 length:357 start_codon:yes stop_codon:yes gene_type:complete